jgi:hypothetical protein
MLACWDGSGYHTLFCFLGSWIVSGLVPRVFTVEYTVKLSLLLEGLCLGPCPLSRRRCDLVAEGNRGVRGAFTLLLLVGYVMDLELSVVLLIRVILLWTPDPRPIGL